MVVFHSVANICFTNQSNFPLHHHFPKLLVFGSVDLKEDKKVGRKAHALGAIIPTNGGIFSVTLE
jgi:hypothetical protein